MSDDGTEQVAQPAAEATRDSGGPKNRPEQKELHPQTSFPEYLESLLVTVLLALFGTSFVVQAFKIPSGSMEDTLLIGDHLLLGEGAGDLFVRLDDPAERRTIQALDALVGLLGAVGLGRSLGRSHNGCPPRLEVESKGSE